VRDFDRNCPAEQVRRFHPALPFEREKLPGTAGFRPEGENFALFLRVEEAVDIERSGAGEQFTATGITELTDQFVVGDEPRFRAVVAGDQPEGVVRLEIHVPVILEREPDVEFGVAALSVDDLLDQRLRLAANGLDGIAAAVAGLGVAHR